MMRFSTAGALRAGLSQVSRQATTTTLVTRAAASTVASSSHAISNPTLANIEKRWEGMPLQEQAELWMALRDRMKENWQDLTLQEKKAGECGDDSSSITATRRLKTSINNGRSSVEALPGQGHHSLSQLAGTAILSSASVGPRCVMTSWETNG